MANIKDMAKIAEKWARASASAQTEYEDGIRNPKADWMTQTVASEKNYNAGVQAAIGRGAFGKGVKALGTAGWQAAALAKGVARWAQGISLSLDKYIKGFEPYRQVIASLTLPARGPKGDAGNIQRVATVAKALHDAKIKKSSS